MSEEFDIVTSPEGEVGTALTLAGAKGMREFVRYFAASLIALVVDTGSLFVLTSVVGISYLYSGALAFMLGLVIVYVLSIAWVFEERTTKSAWVEFTVFAIIGIVGLGINELILWTLTGIFGLYYLVSKVASVAVVFTWNFFARKYALFGT